MPKFSMPRDDAVNVGHMLETARKAVEKVERTSRANFDADENLRLALAHLIQIIGEAASRVFPGPEGYPGRSRPSVCKADYSTPGVLLVRLVPHHASIFSF